MTTALTLDSLFDQRPADFIIRTPASFRYYLLKTKRMVKTVKPPSKALELCLKLLIHLEHGQLDVTLPNGQKLSFRGKNDGKHASIHIHNENVARRAMLGGHVGFCEAYLDRGWTTPDLASLFTLLAENMPHLQRVIFGNALPRFLSRIAHFLKPNSKQGAKKNIYAHYDIGNDFYATWLDPSMSYSSALFENTNDFTEAQNAKYQALLNKIDIQENDHILEIGCGWGGFAEYTASKYPNVKITGVTISKAQYDYALKRIQNAGLEKQVTLKLMDYRDISGQFDKIVSIEMFEAVGEKYWPVFFRTLTDRLKSGGQAGLQIITIRDEDFEDYKRTPDFIQHYIFPGGMLPSKEKLLEHSQNEQFEMSDLHCFGQDYARTLEIWNEHFQEAWPQLSGQFDQRFKRLWELYLKYCQAGFQAGTIDVVQFSLKKT